MFKRLDEINLDWLKKNHQFIHFFGLGFIQIKINNQYRLHFYSIELPAIVGKEEIHNHRYNFKSTILKGKLTQDIFAITPGNDYVLEKESCNVDVKPESVPIPCGIKLLSTTSNIADSAYQLDHQSFHRVSTDPNTITLLSRGGYEKQLADVVRPINKEKVCPFSLKISENRLWEIVDNSLRK